MATSPSQPEARQADFPVAQPVAPPPHAVRPGLPYAHGVPIPPDFPRIPPLPERRAVPVGQPYQSPIRWRVVALAGGLALVGVVALVAACWHFGRTDMAGVAAGDPTAIQAYTAPEPLPTPADEPAVALPPNQEAVEAPDVPEPGILKPAGSAPLAGVLPGPGPAAFPKGYAEPAPVRFKRRSHLSADELRKQLLAVPEVDLDAAPRASSQLLAAARSDRGPFAHPVLDPLTRRPDLHGLPVQMGLDCQIGKEAAQNLQVLSRKLRQHMSHSLPREAVLFALGELSGKDAATPAAELRPAGKHPWP
jgi:hypothetical protein